jgi:hypothetical protein
MKIVLIFLSLVLFSCQTTGDAQTRAYINGTVITNQSPGIIELQLKSENTIIAKEQLNSKDFTLSGPLLGKIFFLVCNQKIKSISGTGNLKISTDSLSVEFPEGLTYSDNLALTLTK